MKRRSCSIETVQGDMRDLSCLQEAAFDIVWHPYSINFIPDVQVVFRQVGVQSLGASRTLQHWNLPDDQNKVKKALKGEGSGR